MFLPVIYNIYMYVCVCVCVCVCIYIYIYTCIISYRDEWKYTTLLVCLIIECNVLQPEILGFGVDGCLRVCSSEVGFCSPSLWQFGACWARRSNGNVCPEQSCCFSYSYFSILMDVEPKPCETTAVCASVPRYIEQFRERLANAHCDLDILLSWSDIYTTSSIHSECLTSTSSVDAESNRHYEYGEHEQCGRREQQSLRIWRTRAVWMQRAAVTEYDEHEQCGCREQQSLNMTRTSSVDVESSGHWIWRTRAVWTQRAAVTEYVEHEQCGCREQQSLNVTNTSSVDLASVSEYDEHEQCGCREQQSLRIWRPRAVWTQIPAVSPNMTSKNSLDAALIGKSLTIWAGR
jgi:hypothetical protein